MRKILILTAAAMLCGITVYAETGDVLGDVYATDIRAYMDDAPIASYNIGGRTVIKAADLRDYGFDVSFDEESRRAEISAVQRPETLPELAENVSGNTGDVIGNYLETDIYCTINGITVESYNINGFTMIVTEDMGNMDRQISRDGNIHAGIGFAPTCIKMEWDETSRKVLLHAVHPGDTVNTDCGDFAIAGGKLKMISGYFPMGYDIYKDIKEEANLIWQSGISDNGLYLPLKSVMEVSGINYTLEGNILNIESASLPENAFSYRASGSANGGSGNVVFPLDIKLTLDGEEVLNEDRTLVYEYEGEVLISLEYLNTVKKMFREYGEFPDWAEQKEIGKIGGTEIIVSVNHKNINSFAASWNGKHYVSADDLAKCGFDVKYDGKKVYITKPAVKPELTEADSEYPEMYFYKDIENLCEAYEGIYDVTVDGTEIENIYIYLLLTIETPCIAVEDLEGIDGYTVEKRDGYVNLYTK